MGARITVGKANIEVDVEDLGEAMRQLAPYLGLGGSSAAPKVRAEWPLPVAEVTPPAVVAARDQAEDDTSGLPPAHASAFRLLKLLRDHRVSGGASSEEVARTVGAAHLKGIGSKMTPINAVLSSVGVQPSEVYSNDRNESGNRMWTAGPKLDEAMERIRGKDLV